MATITSTIKLNDQFSSKVKDMTNTLQIFNNTCNQTTIIAMTTADELRGINDSSKTAGGGIDSLASKLKTLINVAALMATAKKAIDISDDLTSMNARLQMVADNYRLTGTQVDAFTNSIYAAANAARGSFDSMASLVARLGNNATEAFNSADELVTFAEGVQKLMTIGGASTQEASNAMIQLSQALASGVLRGDELNSIFEQAPNLIKLVAEEMGVTMGEIRSLASEGKITADIVKSAILDSMDDINNQFEQMPMTFGQAMTQVQNYALQAFTPVLTQLNGMLNSATGQQLIADAMTLIATAASIASDALTVLGNAIQFVYDNLSTIAPVIEAVVAAYAAYNIVTGLAAVFTAAHGVAATVASAFMALFKASTDGATAAVTAFNTALNACPLTWILIAIMAVVAAVVLFANYLASTGGVAESTFSVICGWISVVIGWFKNLWTNAKIVAENIPIAISMGCSLAKAAFYRLASAAMSAIAKIANALNAIPGITFDTSGLEAAARDYAEKSVATAQGAEKYKDFVSYDYMSAYNEGAQWGNEKVSAASSLANKLSSLGDLQSAGGDYAAQTAANTGSTAGSSGKTAGNTGAIKNKLDDTEEDLKYLCDIAERDAINRFTTASIAVDMVNNNTISSGLDLDGIIDGLTGRLQTSMAMIAEGA